MPPAVSILFEVEDLSQASPATVSRAGMIYLNVEDLGWQPFITSWLQKKDVRPTLIHAYIHTPLDMLSFSGGAGLPLNGLRKHDTCTRCLKTVHEHCGCLQRRTGGA